MSTLTERTYSLDASAGRLLKLIREIGAEIVAGRELACRLFVRDLSAQYRQGYLFYLWAFLPPLDVFTYGHSER
jgi:lipopolysaccharide transport system permease protein